MRFQGHKLPALAGARWRRASLRLLVLFCAACAATHSASPSEVPENQAFARIQVHEAELAAAERRGSASGADCSERCASASEGCRASESLCTIAGELADADALTRCERARTRCEAASAATADCKCSATRER